MTQTRTNSRETQPAGTRHVTILFVQLADLLASENALSDAQRIARATEWLAVLAAGLTRDQAGRVLQTTPDSILAVFDQPSAALNRALEMQRVFSVAPAAGADGLRAPRLGLHMGEVWLREGERLEIINRHVQRARRVMEVAAAGQILASEAVVDAARDFLDTPREHLAIHHYGEFYLQGAGATSLCEVADKRFHQPAPPQIARTAGDQPAGLDRLELAGYRPLRRLGEGPAGVVFEAEQLSSGRRVAVKVLHPAAVSGLNPARLGQPATAVAPVNLEGVAALVESRLEHLPPFIVSEFVAGRSLVDALEGASPERIARVFHRLCDVLGALHRSGQTHGALKPGNVLLESDVTVKLLDAASGAVPEEVLRGSHPGARLPATPAYLAPEILDGQRPDARSDLYAVGVLLFWILAGREPFEARSLHEMIEAQRHEDPPLPSMLRPGVAEGLQRVCLKAMEKRPADRYASAQAMADDLDRFLRGQPVRTRPGVYDNLLFHRIQRHVDDVREWTRRGLLAPEETDRLLGAYDGLRLRGLPAVMEGRHQRLWQTIVYVGGWAVINGALLWLVQHWDALTRPGKLALGSVPALVTFTLAAAMWRAERFRLTFVALLVGVFAVPLLAGVWLREFDVAAAVPEARLPYELLRTHVDGHELSNRQLVWVAFSALVAAGGVMLFTRTTTHSAQGMLALALFYAANALGSGLRPHYEHQEWAAIAVQFLPLLALLAAGAWILLARPDREHQSGPWVFGAALLLIGINYALPLHGLTEWTSWERGLREPASCLFLSAAGILQTAFGLWAHRRLRHRSRLAVWLVIVTGLGNLLAGLTLAGWEGTWPEGWWQLRWFGQSVPVVHGALPLVALGITILASRVQMLSFLLVGLAGFAASIHLLGFLYFEQAVAWPRLLMVFGGAALAVALALELRRTRGRAVDEVLIQHRL